MAGAAGRHRVARRERFRRRRRGPAVRAAGPGHDEVLVEGGPRHMAYVSRLVGAWVGRRRGCWRRPGPVAVSPRTSSAGPPRGPGRTEPADLAGTVGRRVASAGPGPARTSTRAWPTGGSPTFPSPESCQLLDARHRPRRLRQPSPPGHLRDHLATLPCGGVGLAGGSCIEPTPVEIAGFQMGEQEWSPKQMRFDTVVAGLAQYAASRGPRTIGRSVSPLDAGQGDVVDACRRWTHG
jgi:hypothetical protein